MVTKHIHLFKPKTEKLTLAKYRHEDGEIKYQSTNGYDVLEQLVCDCGLVETLNLKRTVL